MMARNAQQPTQNTSSHPFLWVIERCSQYDYPGWRRLTNASKHAFVGRERGEIELEFRQEGASWRLWVFDNGLGMSSDRMDASGGLIRKAFAERVGGSAKCRLRSTAKMALGSSYRPG